MTTQPASSRLPSRFLASAPAVIALGASGLAITAGPSAMVLVASGPWVAGSPIAWLVLALWARVTGLA